jgi:hypothetical protein
MKKQFFLILLLAMATTAFSQQKEPSPTLTKQEYLKKSKKQKTIAWILAGGGVGMAVIAYASYNIGDVANIIEGDNSSINTKGAILIIGGVTALSSIPFFIASGKTKRKGMSLSFKNETVPHCKMAVLPNGLYLL